MPSGPKSYRDFPTRVLQKIRCSFTTSILVKITRIIWRSICMYTDGFLYKFCLFYVGENVPWSQILSLPLHPTTPPPAPHIPAKTKPVTTGFRHCGLKPKTSWARNMFLLLLENDGSENHHCQTTSVSFAGSIYNKGFLDRFPVNFQNNFRCVVSQ